MEYEIFLEEKERAEALSSEEQKAFYRKVLKEEQEKSSVRMLAYFNYARLFYYEGDFQKAREVMEPFVLDYQSYEYRPELISCFNLMGVSSHCEGEYMLTRFFYKKALEIAREHGSSHYFAYEYNNISLTYIAEENFTEATRYILLAEEALPESDLEMGAYVYLNKAAIYHNLGQLAKAQAAFEKCIREYRGEEFLPDDVLLCGCILSYKTGDQEKYIKYREKILERLEAMHASEFMDACKTVFECELDAGNYELVKKITKMMDTYMHEHPKEIKVGLRAEEFKYLYAKTLGNKDDMLSALERNREYYRQIVRASEAQRTTSVGQQLRINGNLQKALQNEARANRSKIQFLANMSHDIRTPMNAIVGITELMGHCLDEPEKLQEYLYKLQLSSRHMLGLVNDLLDMNKMESGTEKLNKEPMNLAEQVEQIEHIVCPQAFEKGQHFEIHLHRICHENLIGDAVRLRQAILNVVTNAVKYTPQGGRVCLDIEELACEIPLRAQYRFTVTDNGPGMEEELQKHIFEPFIRGEDSVTNKIQGTGLGMAITKGIVDIMGGLIRLDSTPGEGSRVEITLGFKIDTEIQTKMDPMNLLLLSKDTDLVENLF